MVNLSEVLKKELIVALGCTEPIAVAYACAKARVILGHFPDRIVVRCSGNIIKNVKAVTVPGTIDMKGLETSAILGAIVGTPEKELELLNDVSDEQRKLLKQKISENICEIELVEDVSNLYIDVHMYFGDESCSVEITDNHNNITKIVKNDEVISNLDVALEDYYAKLHKELVFDDIIEYINTVKFEELYELLNVQIKYNVDISAEGLKNDYGANVGKTIEKYSSGSIIDKIKAKTAAGSDARMSGCVLPVVINSGSGNQGITVSIPVSVYAEEIKCSEDKFYRALALSNLISIYIKSGIGKLSAFCGAVSASCGSGAAIAYLDNSSVDVIKDTIINTLANTGGIICDGAKASCAAKIASSLDASYMSYQMAKDGNVFNAGDGLVTDNFDQTIDNFCRMAKVGMKETDVEILNIMIGK